MPSSTGPQCPQCKTSITNAGTKVVASTTKGGERITLVYCPNCHSVLGVTPGS